MHSSHTARTHTHVHCVSASLLSKATPLHQIPHKLTHTHTHTHTYTHTHTHTHTYTHTHTHTHTHPHTPDDEHAHDPVKV